VVDSGTMIHPNNKLDSDSAKVRKNVPKRGEVVSGSVKGAKTIKIDSEKGK